MKPILAILFAFASCPVLAMDALSEQELSESTGQAGATISLTPAGAGVQGKINVASVISTDRDGFATTINGTSYAGASASLFANMNANSGLLLCTNQVTNCTLSVNPITIDVDIDGTAGVGALPMAYLSVKLPTDVTRIRLDLANIGLGVGNATSTHTIATFSNGINIDLASQFQAAFVLGAEGASTNSDAMINLIQANFSSIDFGTITFNSVGGTANENSLRLGAKVTNLDLSGANINIIGTGLVLTKASVGPFNVLLTDVTAGNTSAAASATVFNNTSVGSLGSFGFTNVTLTNARIAVSGM